MSSAERLRAAERVKLPALYQAGAGPAEGTFKVKISICNELFQEWPIEKVFEYVAQLGYDGVEIAPFTLGDSVLDISQQKRQTIRQVAAQRGLEIVGLHWLLARTKGLYINHPDGTIRDRTRQYLEALIHFCADLGGKILVHGSSGQRTVQPGWDFDKAWNHARDIFEACAEAACQRGVYYCIEPLTPKETNFITRVEEALRMVEQVNHPHFKMMIDCRSASAVETSIQEPLLRVLRSGHLRHVHVNDASGRGPGFGETKFSPILRTLLEEGYQHYLSVEVFQFDSAPETIASRSIGYLRGIFEVLEKKG